MHYLVESGEDHASLAGRLISQKGQIPQTGEVIDINDLHFTIVRATDYRIDLVRITRDPQNHDQDAG